MRSEVLSFLGLSALVLSTPAAESPKPVAAENKPPEVKITAPLEKAGFQWNSLLTYSIDVGDPEDGKSEFSEITANEAFLWIAYLPDAAQTEKYLAVVAKIDNAPVRRMSASNCFTCHTASTKLIGPSFDLIARRYEHTPDAVESLAKKVVGGASGTWGAVPMPPHPDLTIEQAREMVSWILKNNLDPNRSFVVGLEGAFRSREKPQQESSDWTCVLTATYTDHGAKDAPETAVQGAHSVVLKYKK